MFLVYPRIPDDAIDLLDNISSIFGADITLIAHIITHRCVHGDWAGIEFLKDVDCGLNPGCRGHDGFQFFDERKRPIDLRRK